MKKILVCALAVGFAVTTANAAKLSIDFGGATNYDITTPAVGGTVEVNIVLQLNTGDTLKGIGLRFQETGANIGLASVEDGSGSNTLGWVDQTIGGDILTDPGHGYGAFSNTALVGDGSTFVVGSLLLDLEPAPAGTVVELMINDPGSVSLIDNAGALYAYGPTFAGSFPGFFDYGTGSPAVTPGPFGGQSADPITITYTPEPASLALLAIGGVALLRRRR